MISKEITKTKSQSQSQSLEIKGLVQKIFDVQYLKNGFKKREILLLTEEQYPQKLIIEFIQEKVKLLYYIGVGDRIKVFLNLKGRKCISSNGTEKYFNSIQGWKIEKKRKLKSSNISEDEFEEKPHKKSNENSNANANENELEYFPF